MSVYVTDTHPIIFYATGQHHQLTPKVRKTFEAAARGDAFIWVPAIVVWEIGLLIKKGRVQLQDGLALWCSRLRGLPGFDIAALTHEISAAACEYPGPDPFDALIASTAKVLDLALITRDERISSSGFVTIHW